METWIFILKIEQNTGYLNAGLQKTGNVSWIKKDTIKDILELLNIKQSVAEWNKHKEDKVLCSQQIIYRIP